MNLFFSLDKFFFSWSFFPYNHKKMRFTYNKKYDKTYLDLFKGGFYENIYYNYIFVFAIVFVLFNKSCFRYR